jgi:hypothetical protein
MARGRSDYVLCLYMQFLPSHHLGREHNVLQVESTGLVLRCTQCNQPLVVNKLHHLYLYIWSRSLSFLGR